VLIARTESVSFFQSMVAPLAVLNALVAEIADADAATAHGRVDACTHLYRRLGALWDDTAPPNGVSSNGRASPPEPEAAERRPIQSSTSGRPAQRRKT